MLLAVTKSLEWVTRDKDDQIRPRADTSWDELKGINGEKAARTTLYIANFPEISRNGIYSQKPTPAGGKQQNKQKPAKTSLSFSPVDLCERSKMEKWGQASSNNALLMRKRARRPRPSRSRQDQARASEVRPSKAPPCSSARRPRVRSPVPVVAPPSRGNTPEGWISGTGGNLSAHFRWQLFPSPLRGRLWLSVR